VDLLLPRHHRDRNEQPYYEQQPVHAGSGAPPAHEGGGVLFAVQDGRQAAGYVDALAGQSDSPQDFCKINEEFGGI
jgi:hypothetical protein